jgi:hypothetical protein
MSDGHIIFPSPPMHYPLRAALSGFRNARKSAALNMAATQTSVFRTSDVEETVSAVTKI